MRTRKDSYVNCPSCRKEIWMSQITMVYTEAERSWWLLTGICKDCQKDG
jgi:hypothetical protein